MQSPPGITSTLGKTLTVIVLLKKPNADRFNFKSPSMLALIVTSLLKKLFFFSILSPSISMPFK